MSTRTRGLLSGAVLVALVAAAAPARGQDEAAAAALFDKGLAEMKAGRFESGCPKLAESYRADPRPGVLFTLADCETDWGRVASAVAHYEDFLKLAASQPASSRQKARTAMARERVAQLGPKVPTLVVELSKTAPPATAVKRDGAPLGAQSLGLALPADPGEHTLSAQAPGGAETTKTVTLKIGEHARVVLDVEPPPPSSAASSPPASAAAAPSAVPDRAASGDGGARSPETASLRRPIALAIGAVGLAGVAVGAVTGLLAVSQKSTISSNCRDTLCNADGKHAADTAKTLALVSTVGFVAGGAAVGLGVVLFATAPPSRPRRAARPIVVAAPGIAYGGMEAAF